MINLPNDIDAGISRNYGIAPYGLYGFEVQRNRRQAAKFNEHQPGKGLTEQDAKLANWQAAVLWAGQNPAPQEDRPWVNSMTA